METSYYISVAIKQYLDEHGMKSYKLAEASGCNKTALNDWLYQRKTPNAKAFLKLCDYTNLSVDYMLGRSSEKHIIKASTPEKFGTRIMRLIAEQNITLYRLAQRCGIEPGAVTKWKDMTRLPKLETLIKLSDTLGYSIDYILGRTNIY